MSDSHFQAPFRVLSMGIACIALNTFTLSAEAAEDETQTALGMHHLCLTKNNRCNAGFNFSKNFGLNARWSWANQTMLSMGTRFSNQQTNKSSFPDSDALRVAAGIYSGAQWSLDVISWVPSFKLVAGPTLFKSANTENDSTSFGFAVKPSIGLDYRPERSYSAGIEAFSSISIWETQNQSPHAWGLILKYQWYQDIF